jgi:VIT1/CCC1 family predicted Fe2+/Mn2+ transporter
MASHAPETHRTSRIGWLRAAVLGANDGIVSTGSLVVGVAAAEASRSSVFVAGIAGLVAGALSMAAGEYVSVSSQSDTERADLDRERRELADSPQAEEDELAGIYVSRGLDPVLARTVAQQLTSRDALGISPYTTARPLQAALASAAAFAIGAGVPLFAMVLSPEPLIVSVVATSLVCLAALGALAGQVGGASAVTGALRVTVWGAVAMAVTAAVGTLVGAAP